MFLPCLMCAKGTQQACGVTPEIQAYIDNLIEKTSQKYEASIAGMWEQFRRAQTKRYLPQTEKFQAQGCLFNEA